MLLEFLYFGSRCWPVLLFIEREAVPAYIHCFLPLKRAEGPGICCFSPRTGTLFSVLLTLGDPALLAGGWWACVCAHALCHYSFSLLYARESCPSQALPSQPQLGTKVQRGITGWGAQVTPLYSASLGQVKHQPPGGVGQAVLKEEGDQCSNLPGTPTCPHIGACALGMGIPPKGPTAWASSVAAAHLLTPGHAHAP